MQFELTNEQREKAMATANLVAATMVRLEREHGEAAMTEAMRHLCSAMSSDERRKFIALAMHASIDMPLGEAG